MGAALLTGLLDSGFDAADCSVAEADPDRRHDLESAHPAVRIVPSAAWAVADADVAVVAVKPADVASVLEPIFLKYDVSVVFAGHDHFYERTKPQKGIVHFVTGSGGKLRKGDINRRSGLTAVGFDTDQAFLAAEIKDDRLYFNAISRTGAVVDSGVIERRKLE